MDIQSVLLANTADDLLFYIRLAENSSWENFPCVSFNKMGACTNGFHPLYMLFFLLAKAVGLDSFYLVFILEFFALTLSTYAVFRVLAGHFLPKAIMTALWFFSSYGFVMSGMETNIILIIFSLGLLLPDKSLIGKYVFPVLSMARTDFSVIYTVYKLIFDRRGLFIQIFCMIFGLSIFALYGFKYVGSVFQISSIAKSGFLNSYSFSLLTKLASTQLIFGLVISVLIFGRFNISILSRTLFFLTIFGLYYLGNSNSINWVWYRWPVYVSFLVAIPFVKPLDKIKSSAFLIVVSLMYYGSFHLNIAERKFFHAEADRINSELSGNIIMGDLVGYLSYRLPKYNFLHAEGLVVSYSELQNLKNDFASVLEHTNYLIATVNEVKPQENGFIVQYSPLTVGEITPKIFCSKAKHTPAMHGSDGVLYVFEAKQCHVTH